jgi:hypothetical protein
MRKFTFSAFLLIMDILVTVLLASVKFAMTFPLAIMEFHFGFFETILWINVGGLLGVYFFAYLSEGLNRWIQRTIIRRRKSNPLTIKIRKKKIFTKRNRRIIRIKNRYGLPGIIITTPFLLSIPLGVFIVTRYYRLKKARYIYLVCSNIAWSILYTSFYMFWYETLFVR